MWIQGLAGVESGSKINGSQPSEGAQQATGDQIQQKPSRNVISGPVSPLGTLWQLPGGCRNRKQSGFLIVHILY